MARVLIYASEVGGAAVLSAVVAALEDKGHECVVAGMGKALGCFRERCSSSTVVRTFDPSLIDAGFDVCLAGYGSPLHDEGVAAWQGIAGSMPTIILLDHWKGLERFFDAQGECRQPRPSRILAPSKSVRSELISLGVPREDVVVTGHPTLALCAGGEYLKGVPPREDLLSRLKVSPGMKVHVLASEGIHHGGHPCWDVCQPSCYRLFNKVIGTKPLWRVLVDEYGTEETVFILRPHPTETVPVDSGILTVDWDILDDRHLLAVADTVYGISSMLVMQAAAMGRDVVLVHDLVPGWLPEWSFMRKAVWQEMQESGLLDGALAPQRHEVTAGMMAELIDDQISTVLAYR